MRGCVNLTDEGQMVLMLRYLGQGKALSRDETEILLFALYLESKSRGGLAIRGWEALFPTPEVDGCQ